MKPIQLAVFTIIFVVISLNRIHAQSPDPLRYTDDVEEITSKKYSFNEEQPRIVFAGSSSIKMWDDIERRFSNFNVVNAGFGGSHMNELLYWSDELITKFNPDAVFIYEGDNDIAEGKTPELVISQTVELIAKLKSSLPDTRYFLISAKPSPARWDLKSEYEELNKRFEQLATLSPAIDYVDIWSPMLSDDGSEVKSGIYLKDNLHMNSSGYDIWEDSIRPFIGQVF